MIQINHEITFIPFVVNYKASVLDICKNFSLSIFQEFVFLLNHGSLCFLLADRYPRKEEIDTPILDKCNLSCPEVPKDRQNPLRCGVHRLPAGFSGAEFIQHLHQFIPMYYCQPIKLQASFNTSKKTS